MHWEGTAEIFPVGIKTKKSKRKQIQRKNYTTFFITTETASRMANFPIPTSIPTHKLQRRQEENGAFFLFLF